jgi:hypothetical protein
MACDKASALTSPAIASVAPERRKSARVIIPSNRTGRVVSRMMVTAKDWWYDVQADDPQAKSGYKEFDTRQQGPAAGAVARAPRQTAICARTAIRSRALGSPMKARCSDLSGGTRA